MRPEERSALSVLLVLLVAGTMTVVAVGPGPNAGDGATSPSQSNAPTSDAGTPSGVTGITVSATGTVQGEPDVAVLSLESSATASTPGAAAERLARNVSRLRGALQAANLSDDQIRTTYYDLSEEQLEPEKTATGADVETRYVARQGLAVRVENTSRVGDLVDTAVANGATAVRNVEFTLSPENRTALRERALEKAMADARNEAETLASTENLTVVGVGAISTADGGVQPFVARETAGVAAGDAPTRIDSGPITVEARVDVTYNATESG